MEEWSGLIDAIGGRDFSGARSYGTGNPSRTPDNASDGTGPKLNGNSAQDVQNETVEAAAANLGSELIKMLIYDRNMSAPTLRRDTMIMRKDSLPMELDLSRTRHYSDARYVFPK
jgi:hypothetical protein